MIKLTDLKGADSVLPGKSVARWGSENQEVYVAYSNGFNNCRASLETVSLVLDLGSMTLKLSEAIESKKIKGSAYEISKYFSDNINLFARLEKSK